MSSMPSNNQPNGPPQQLPPAPPEPVYRWRFRWAWVYVPCACLIAAAVIASVATPAFTWGDVLALLQVRNATRYTQLGMLAIALIGLVVVIRLMRAWRDM